MYISIYLQSKIDSRITVFTVNRKPGITTRQQR